MYSPKIAEELIPELYRVSKARGKPMTQVVSEFIRNGLKQNQAGNLEFHFMQVKEAEGGYAESPQAITGIMKTESKADRECFWILHLNTRNKIIEKELVSVGIINKALVHPREAFKKAILNGAASIITVHNHPGNYIKPSDEDRLIWEKLDKAGEILGIKALDHIIIMPSGEYYSRKESHQKPVQF